MAAGSERVVGRRAELARLESVLHEAEDGRASSVLLSGAAGVGKTTLLGALGKFAARTGFRVLNTAGFEFEVDLAFGALSELLWPEREAIEALPRAWRSALHGALAIEDRPSSPLAVYHATLALLGLLGARHPVLLVVDDLQWVDASSLGVLRFVTHRLGAERVAIVYAGRVEAMPALDGAGIDAVPLEGLPVEDAADLLDAHGAQGERARRCWEMTGGNPLAMLHAWRSLTRGQRSGDEPMPNVPDLHERLLTAFGAVVSDLDQDELTALAVAALEPTGNLSLIAEALENLGRSPDDLTAGEHVGILFFKDGILRWRHPLWRAAVHARAGPATRRAAHRALAVTSVAGMDPERRVWHVASAAVGPDEYAAELLEQAGTRLLRRAALPAAAEAFWRAARLSPDADDGGRRLLRAGDAAWANGDPDRVVRILGPVVDELTDPLVAARMAEVLGQAEMWLVGARPAVRRFLRHADAVEPTAPEQAAFLLLHASVAYLLGLAPDRAVAMARQAEQLAGRSGDAMAIFGAGAMVAVASVLDGDVADREEQLRQVLALATAALGNGSQGVDALVQLSSFALVMLDRWEEVAGHLDEVADDAARTGYIGRASFARFVRTEALWRSGRWPEALAESSLVLSITQATSLGAIAPIMLALSARIEACLGLSGPCSEHAHTAIEIGRRSGLQMPAAWAHSALGLLALGEGRMDDAVSAFEQVDALAGHLDQSGWLWWEADAVEALHAVGDHRRARLWSDRLTTRRDAAGGRWAVCAGLRCQAVLDDDLDRHDEAVSAFEALGNTFETGRALLLRGRARRRRSRDADGAHDLRRARTLFDRIAARPWSAAASTALDEPVADSPTLTSLLSPAELRVALAVARGRTNREAAEVLYLGEKTIESHLRRIYLKLGVRNRTEMTRLVTYDPQAVEGFP